MIDYYQKEWLEWKRSIDRMKNGRFSFISEIYPSKERFFGIREPIATVSDIGLNGTSDILAQIPFCGSLVLNITPVSKNVFEEIFFKISEIPNVIRFIKETGRLQIVFSSGALAYDGLDYLDPFFKELNPPCYFGLPISMWASVKNINIAEETFKSIANINYTKWMAKKYETNSISDDHLFLALNLKMETYVFLFLNYPEVIQEINNLLVDDPENANTVLNIYKAFIYAPSADLISQMRNYSLDAIEASQILPQNLQSKPLFPFEIGKFLLNKLTYAPLGFDACRELMYNYDAYDLTKVQGALNQAILKYKPDIVKTRTKDISEILDNVWNDKTIVNRIKGLKSGLPISMAIIGTLAAGPIGTTSGFLAGLGYNVADKFLDLGTDGISECLAKIRIKNYLATVFNFKKEYKHRIVKEGSAKEKRIKDKL